VLDLVTPFPADPLGSDAGAGQQDEHEIHFRQTLLDPRSKFLADADFPLIQPDIDVRRP
jgi:hypothetical protein